MKFLHSWLQEYIEDKLPEKDDLLEAISVNAFEVEEVFEIENKLTGEKDFVYDLNVLPNRAHDALSHYFMAKDIAAILGLKFKERTPSLGEGAGDGLGERTPSLSSPNPSKGGENPLLWRGQGEVKVKRVESENNSLIRIADPKACTRFMGALVENIEVKESPDFIKYRLEAIGQKSINNIVDITNYVQFAFNKPMHAYDQNLIVDFLEARFAKEGESMTTLDNRELALDTETLVIADKEKVLALAGIKGGNSSGISENTKNIIIESANFNETLVRKTSQKYNLKTDASKRFENSIADDLVEIGMLETLKLIKEYASNENTKIVIHEIEDNFPKRKMGDWVYKISVSKNEINSLLGTKLSREEIENIFKKYGFEYKYISAKENLENLIQEVLGKEYKNPSSMREDAPNAFSCSSLISYLYEGVYMPSISIDKYLYTKDLAEENNLKEISDLRFGDLVFTSSEDGKIRYEGVEYKKGEKVEGGVDHAGIYLGDRKILHSSRFLEKGTEIESVEKFLEKRKLTGFGRVLQDMEEKRFIVSAPKERLDLRIKEDIIEEIGRAFGLHNIVGVVPDLNREGLPNKRLFYETKIRNILLANGFSEVSTYSLRDKGDIQILKSVAQDKDWLRINLIDGIQEAVQKNIFNLPVLNAKDIRIFEFGNVFSMIKSSPNPSEGGESPLRGFGGQPSLGEGVERSETEGVAPKEQRNLAIAIDDGKKNKEYRETIEKVLEEIKKELRVEKIDFTEFKNERQKENSIEINFDALIESLDEPDKFIGIDKKFLNEEVKYKVFPLTPFIVRDVACWTPENTMAEDIEKIILENITPLCQSVKLFDEFEKEVDGVKKKSFAFRLIYQDENRTLTDEEVNVEADKIYEALKSYGFEIR